MRTPTPQSKPRRQALYLVRVWHSQKTPRALSLAGVLICEPQQGVSFASPRSVRIGSGLHWVHVVGRVILSRTAHRSKAMAIPFAVRLGVASLISSRRREHERPRPSSLVRVPPCREDLVTTTSLRRIATPSKSMFISVSIVVTAAISKRLRASQRSSICMPTRF